MVNGIISIEMFDALDTIALKYKIKIKDWATASWGKEMYQSRISELRTKARFNLQGVEGGAGRAFSASKCFALLTGLKKIIGEEAVARELNKMLKKAKTAKERMLLMVMALDEKDEAQAELFLRAVTVKSSK